MRVMRICVATKIVPRQAVQYRIDQGTHRLNRTGASELNPSDAYAVEEALAIRERAGEGEVVAVSMGPAAGAEGLRAALAMGVDRAVLAADPLLEGSDLVATSRVLAAVIAREAPGLVLFGSQSADGGGSLLWAAVAERLGLPVLSGVRDVRIVDSAVKATRTARAGDMVLLGSLPCVVALSGSVNVPRYPSFRDVLAAKRREIAIVPVAELGLAADACGTPGSRTKVLGLGAAPPRRGAGPIVEDDGHAAEWLYRFLVDRGVV